MDSILTNPKVPRVHHAPSVRKGLVLWMSACLAPVVSAQQPSDEQLIRAARGRSNAAIAAHDLTAIAGEWMPDVHVVSSTSAQTAGREANQQRMAQQFTNRPDTIYVRTPSSVEVNAAWAVASERGEWVGRWIEPDGKLEIAGTYQAQWRKVGGRWLIQAELFVPTRCAGSVHCLKRP